MERISKPHIVDLLRIFDRRRLLMPRIRYASVRSKPELIKDLRNYFYTYERDGVLLFRPRQTKEASLCHLPRISYDFAKKQYRFDDCPLDVPAESRKRVRFSISHEPVTMYFPTFGPSADPPSTGTAAVSFPASPEPGTCVPPGS